MPLVHVYQTPKPVEKRRELIKTITEAFGTAQGYAPDTVEVWIHETAPDAFGVGGKLASD